MHRDSEEYRNTRRMIEYFRAELRKAQQERGEPGLLVRISRAEPPECVVQDSEVVKDDAAAEMGMGAAEAGATFIRAVQAQLIGATFDPPGHHVTSPVAFVSDITPQGLTMLEGWEEPLQPQAPIFNIFGDTYGSIIGTQPHPQILQPTFTFADLEQAIDQHGGEDAAALKEMVREIRTTLESQASLSPGWLLGSSELINRHAWITGPIAQLLLVYAISGQVS